MRRGLVAEDGLFGDYGLGMRSRYTYSRIQYIVSKQVGDRIIDVLDSIANTPPSREPKKCRCKSPYYI